MSFCDKESTKLLILQQYHFKGGSIALKCMMTVMVILVAWARLPELLSEPRFWAEEGTNYFSFAYGHNWLVNLFSPQFGYNTLYNSIATSLAAMVPLDYAPAVTTYLAFFVQLSVSAAAIWWDVPLLDSLLKKFAVAILIQTLAYARIWVTTIGVQYWLCILSVLILLYNHDAGSRRMLVLQHCLLALNGLTGILSCLLIPAFALKAVKTRSRQVIIQTAILSLCLGVQVAVFTWFSVNDHADLKIRFGDSSLIYILGKIIRFQITVPFFERYVFSSPLGVYLEIKIRNALFTVTGPAINSPRYNFYFLEMSLGLATFCYLCSLAYRKIRQLDTQLLVISILLVTAVSTYFSVNSSGGPRYAFAPSIMIMLLVVSAATDKTIPKAMRYVATVLVVLSLTTSLMHYRSNMTGGVAYDPSWPKWHDELTAWRTDHTFPLGIWPPPWKMALSGK
jgi:hypothetical protein